LLKGSSTDISIRGPPGHPKFKDREPSHIFRSVEEAAKMRLKDKVAIITSGTGLAKVSL
jgi:hypothetical protein